VPVTFIKQFMSLYIHLSDVRLDTLGLGYSIDAVAYILQIFSTSIASSTGHLRYIQLPSTEIEMFADSRSALAAASHSDVACRCTRGTCNGCVCKTAAILCGEHCHANNVLECGNARRGEVWTCDEHKLPLSGNVGAFAWFDNRRGDPLWVNVEYKSRVMVVPRVANSGGSVTDRGLHVHATLKSDFWPQRAPVCIALPAATQLLARMCILAFGYCVSGDDAAPVILPPSSSLSSASTRSPPLKGTCIYDRSTPIVASEAIGMKRKVCYCEAIPSAWKPTRSKISADLASVPLYPLPSARTLTVAAGALVWRTARNL
jgi:hypothetical protein